MYTIKFWATVELDRAITAVNGCKRALEATNHSFNSFHDLITITGGWICPIPKESSGPLLTGPMRIFIRCYNDRILAHIAHSGLLPRVIEYVWYDINTFFDEINQYLTEYYKVIYK